MEALGGAKRSLVNSEAVHTSTVSKKSRGPSSNSNMDLDQHPFVRMAHNGGINSTGTGNTALAVPPTNANNSPEKRRALYLELYRLLHAMQAHEAPVDQSWEALLMRVERAESLWQQLVALVETRTIMKDDDDDEYAKVQMSMDVLEEQLQTVTRRGREIVLERRQQDTSVNHMERIFLAPLVAAAAQRQEEVGNSHDDDDDEPANEKNTPAEDSPFRTPAASKATATATTSAAQPAPNIQDLQKAQREQIEEAISQMASQMKAETARIHATLQNQTVGLDQMEDIASENVVKVTQVAQDVQQHVAANWTKAIGTWTLLFTVLGTFLFCLVTISMIPKRSGACLFFCAKTDEQFCRILPGGRKECINVADMEQQHRRDEEEAIAASESVFLDQDVDAKGTQEQICEMGMNGECLNLREKEDPIPEIPGKDMFEDTFEAFQDPQTAEVVKEPVKPKRATEGGGMGGGGLFSQANAIEVDPETVPVYKGKPFAPRHVREAASKGDTSRLAAYLRKKPDWVNKQDKNLWAPLHLAVRSGSLKTVEMLLDADCDDQLVTFDGRTALDMAIESFGQDHPIVKVLEEY
jgi:hypothetical protein